MPNPVYNSTSGNPLYGVVDGENAPMYECCCACEGCFDADYMLANCATNIDITFTSIFGGAPWVVTVTFDYGTASWVGTFTQSGIDYTVTLNCNDSVTRTWIVTTDITGGANVGQNISEESSECCPATGIYDNVFPGIFNVTI